MATLRPCDGSGDVLPVLSVSDLLEGSDVTAFLCFEPGFRKIYRLSCFNPPTIQPAALKKNESSCQSCNTAADMPLPADSCTETVDQVDDNPPQRVRRIQIVLYAEDQRGRHEAPDRAACSCVDSIASAEVDQQSGSKDPCRIDHSVLYRTDLVFETEAIDDKADHIAGKMIETKMQKSADDHPKIRSMLQRTFIHAVGIDCPILSHNELVK